MRSHVDKTQKYTWKRDRVSTKQTLWFQFKLNFSSASQKKKKPKTNFFSWTKSNWHWLACTMIQQKHKTKKKNRNRNWKQNQTESTIKTYLSHLFEFCPSSTIVHLFLMLNVDDCSHSINKTIALNTQHIFIICIAKCNMYHISHISLWLTTNNKSILLPCVCFCGECVNHCEDDDDDDDCWHACWLRWHVFCQYTTEWANKIDTESSNNRNILLLYWFKEGVF